MSYWWQELQTEYDELLLKQSKTDTDHDRINQIEAALIGQFGPEAFAPMCGSDLPYGFMEAE